MINNITSQKAQQDLSVIKETFSRVTGATIITDALFSMSALLIYSGLSVIIAAIVNYWAITKYDMTPELKRNIIIMWVGLSILAFMFKIFFVVKRAIVLKMELFTYVRHIFSGVFLKLDIPMEIVGAVTGIFYLRIGHPEYIMPMYSMYMGLFIISMGVIFVENSFLIAGYVYLICGALGLLFFTNYMILYVGLVFGLFSIILGIGIHNASKKRDFTKELSYCAIDKKQK